MFICVSCSLSIAEDLLLILVIIFITCAKMQVQSTPALWTPHHFGHPLQIESVRRGGLMVSGLDSGLGGPGSGPGRGTALCS